MTDLSFFEQAISFVLHIDQHLFALVAEYGALLYLFLFTSCSVKPVWW